MGEKIAHKHTKTHTRTDTRQHTHMHTQTNIKHIQRDREGERNRKTKRHNYSQPHSNI